MKRPKLRWLASLLLLAAFYPGLARNADAQVDTTYNIGDEVEFQYNYGPAGWMKGKIATKCIGGNCGVLKWDDHFDVWQDGWITINLPNIRRPGAVQSAPSPQASPQAPSQAPQQAPSQAPQQAPPQTSSPGDVAPACPRPPC